MSRLWRKWLPKVTTQRTAKLRDAAEAAYDGEWEPSIEEVAPYRNAEDEDERFVALCDPQTVLKLLDVVEAAREAYEGIVKLRESGDAGYYPEQEDERKLRLALEALDGE